MYRHSGVLLLRLAGRQYTPKLFQRHVHDLQATILHLLGLDHKRLTFRFQGRDFRLTDVAGHLIQDILA